MKAGIDYVAVGTPFYCNDGNGLFLLHRRSERCRDEHGTWDPGSGQLEFGQSLEESVLRGVLEEYGCAGEIQERLPASSVIRQWAGQTTHWVQVPFFIKVKPSDVHINEPEKIDEIGWFRLQELPRPLHTGFDWTLEHYHEYFTKYF